MSDILIDNTVQGYAKEDGKYYNIVKTIRKTSKAGNEYNAMIINVSEMERAIAANPKAEWKDGQTGDKLVTLLASARPKKKNVAAETLEAIRPQSTLNPTLSDEIPF